MLAMVLAVVTDAPSSSSGMWAAPWRYRLIPPSFGRQVGSGGELTVLAPLEPAILGATGYPGVDSTYPQRCTFRPPRAALFNRRSHPVTRSFTAVRERASGIPSMSCGHTRRIQLRASDVETAFDFLQASCFVGPIKWGGQGMILERVRSLAGGRARHLAYIRPTLATVGA